MNSTEKLIELKAKLNREPFRAFVIELLSGRQVTIGENSEVLLPRRRPELVIAFTEDGLQHEFEVSVIASLVEAT